MTKLPVRLVRLGSCRVAESEPRPKRRPAGNESTGAPISSEVQDECKMPRKSNKEGGAWCLPCELAPRALLEPLRAHGLGHADALPA